MYLLCLLLIFAQTPSNSHFLPSHSIIRYLQNFEITLPAAATISAFPVTFCFHTPKIFRSFLFNIAKYL